MNSINLKIEDGMKELSEIIKNNYMENEKFRSELYKVLAKKTGNENLGKLIESMIDNVTKL